MNLVSVVFLVVSAGLNGIEFSAGQLVREMSEEKLEEVNKHASTMNSPLKTDYVNDSEKRPVMESSAEAELMLKLGKGEYLPSGDRTQAFISSGLANNAKTGLLTVIRLQQRLMVAALTDPNVKAFDKVTVLLGRDEDQNDTVRSAPLPLGKIAKTRDEKLAEIQPILDILKNLMPPNGYLPIHEIIGQTTVDSVINQIDITKLALNMDAQMGPGKPKYDTMTKETLGLAVSNEIAKQGVPIYGHDGRSCLGNKDANKKITPAKYVINTARVQLIQRGQGLVVTDVTEAALNELLTADKGFASAPAPGEGITVAYVSTLAGKTAKDFEKPFRSVGTLTKAFEALDVQISGPLYVA